MMIVVPRHPDRAFSIHTELLTAGWVSALKKDIPAMDPETRIDIIVVDGIGLLKTLYALADIAFVGGSLMKAGGHNPLEPAAFGKPVLFGQRPGGGICVHDAESIYRAVDMFFKNEETALDAGRNAFKLLTANRGAVEKTIAAVDAVISNGSFHDRDEAFG